MYAVGLDLAWGERGPTGLAALDAAGVLVHVSTVRTDAEIVAALAPYVGGDCVAGVDAPLVVVNPTGARPAETALNRDFRAFEAGAHPANTGRPVFASGTRGARVATRLGLAVDPDPPTRRRAIEVYPHPATISLFGLGRTLKYKQKQGRELSGLRAELLRLCRLLETLATARTPLRLHGSGEWAALVAAAGAATRKSQLRVVEDQVDAVLCAYLARYAEAEPDRVTTYGDPATGRVVVPTLPAWLEPSSVARIRPGRS